MPDIMPSIDKEKILAGRVAVDSYRTAHAKLYEKGWHKGIPEEHTPLLEKMLKAWEPFGYTLDNFWEISEELNMKELGFKDRKDFEAKATKQDIDTLDRMWE